MAKQNKKLAQVFHYDLYGKRQEKYDFLIGNSINSINWNILENKKPYFFFVTKNFEDEDEYKKGFKIDEIYLNNNTGIQTKRDALVYNFDERSLNAVIANIILLSDDVLRNKYNLTKDGRDWTISYARKDLAKEDGQVVKILYHPFDERVSYFTGRSKGFMAYPRSPLSNNCIQNNLSLLAVRNSRRGNVNNYYITNNLVDKDGVSPLDNCKFFPLYLYPIQETDKIFTEKDRKPNLNTEIVDKIAKKLGLEFVPEKNSPPLEGCLKGGVVNNEQQTPNISINNTLIKRNFIENLPYNPKLKQLARNKRKAGILSEVLFWQQVHKGKFYKIDFDRQRIIGNYIVDFYVKTLGLVIEIDGSSHDGKEEYDKSRQDYLEALGLKVYRIEDLDVKRNIAQVMQDLENYIMLEYGDNTTPSVGHPSKGGEFAPIDILDYIYAVLHSPTYREKYKEFLKIDFPRVPFPKNKETFWQLVKLGGEIRQIHLLESPKVEEYITGYPIDGDNNITTKIGKKDWEITSPPNLPEGETLGRIWINENQYFENIPLTAWEFYIGGYQPAQKWLKDRKGRELSFDDILHYQKIIVALFETGRLMKEIEKIEIE